MVWRYEIAITASNPPIARAIGIDQAMAAIPKAASGMRISSVA